MDPEKYTPETTSRRREMIEWSITYSYNATDLTTPRVLLIGDSICNGYQGRVREYLDGRVNVTFWASSKCVTDPDYFKELCYMLGTYPYDMICYNNALHSLTTDRGEWTAAFRSAVRCIRETLPDTKLSLVSPTPLKDSSLTAITAELNGVIRETAENEKLPFIDLFSLMDPLDRGEYWSDTYHFRAAAVDMQAKLISEHVIAAIGRTDAAAAAEHAQTETGPDGGIR